MESRILSDSNISWGYILAQNTENSYCKRHDFQHNSPLEETGFRFLIYHPVSTTIEKLAASNLIENPFSH